VSLGSAHILGEDFIFTNLKFQLQGTAPNVRYGLAGSRHDGGGVRHNAEVISGRAVEVERVAISILEKRSKFAPSTLIVPTGAGFVVDVADLFLRWPKSKTICCKSCRCGNLPMRRTNARLSAVYGELEIIPDEDVARRSSRAITSASTWRGWRLCGESCARTHRRDQIASVKNWSANSKPGSDGISCSTTMELGGGIGGIRGRICRNVPPGIQNYQQRPGRAGRRAQLRLYLSPCPEPQLR